MSMSKTEKLTQFSVLLIAVCAVVVSVWQVRISQQHNKLSVRPYLDFFSGWSGENSWRLSLLNEGVGPAIVKSTELIYKGKTYSHWDAVLDAAGIREKRINSTNIGTNSPFATDKEVTFVELERDPMNATAYGISIIIKYTSIYEEPFELKLDI